MKRISPEWLTLLRLLILSLSFGVIVSLYVVGVSQLMTRQAHGSPVDEAALLAARELQGIVVVSPHFGRIGLCDLLGTGTANSRVSSHGVVGLNSIYANLRLTAAIAEHIKHPLISRLVGQDIDEMHRLESELRFKMYQAVEPSLHFSDTDAGIHMIHARVHEYLSSHKTSEREILIGCRITLGRVASQDVSSRMPVAAGEDVSALSARDGFYRPYMQLPVPGASPVQFVALADKVKLIDPKEFVRADSDVTPSAVLVEVEYKEGKLARLGSGAPTVQRASCAMVGGPAQWQPRCVFMLSFPHGAPPQLRSVADILFNKSSKSGFWQQAIGGEAPGYMSLGPVAAGQLGEMQAGDAMAVALYHWLRQLGPAMNITNVLSLFYQVWSPPEDRQAHMATLNAESAAGQLKAAELTTSVNTCLARDTGAPEYAIFNQTGFGGLGRAALGSAFSLWGSNQALPPSALPLYVDASGECNLPSRSGIDERLVKDFLVALHRTNLAGIESQAVAKIITKRADLALQQLSQATLLSREELRSLSQRMDRIRGQGKTPMADEVVLVSNRAKMLNQALLEGEAKRRAYLRKKALCSVVLANGEKAASRSFAVCLNMKQMVGAGLYRVETPQPGFLLGKRLYFIPRINPATEEDINKAALDETLVKACPWLSRDFPVLQEAHEPMMAEGLSLRQIIGQHEPIMPMRPFVAVLDSQTVTSGQSPLVKIFPRSPFVNVPLSVGNLVYYSRNALETGRKTKVLWSVLLRDLAAFPRNDNEEGFPLSHESNWCRQGYLAPAPCPGLACELQVRSPIPELPHLELGATLANPHTGEHVSQVPPVPPNML